MIAGCSDESGRLHGVGSNPETSLGKLNGDCDYLEVRCGHIPGFLHLPTMEIIPLADDGQHLRSGVPSCMSVNAFERLGGKGHCRRWQASIVVPLGEGKTIPLGRWLSIRGAFQRNQASSSGPADSYKVIEASNRSIGGPLRSLLTVIGSDVESQTLLSTGEKTSGHGAGYRSLESLQEMSAIEGQKVGEEEDNPSGDIQRTKESKDVLGKRRYSEIFPLSLQKLLEAPRAAAALTALRAECKSIKTLQPPQHTHDIGHIDCHPGKNNVKEAFMRNELKGTSSQASLGHEDQQLALQVHIPSAAVGSLADRMALVESLRMENALQRHRIALSARGSIQRTMENQALKSLEAKSQQALITSLLKEAATTFAASCRK